MVHDPQLASEHTHKRTGRWPEAACLGGTVTSRSAGTGARRHHGNDTERVLVHLHQKDP